MVRKRERRNLRGLPGFAPFAALLVPSVFTSGLTARLLGGDWVGEGDILSLSFCFLRVPSLISPPDASLPEAASARFRL